MNEESKNSVEVKVCSTSKSKSNDTNINEIIKEILLDKYFALLEMDYVDSEEEFFSARRKKERNQKNLIFDPIFSQEN